MMQTWLLWIGLVLQVAGLCVTGLGIKRTWRSFGEGGFWDSVTAPLIEMASSILSFVRRLLRICRRTQVHELHGSVSATATLTATAHVRWAAIKPGGRVKESIAQLDDRTRRLHEQVQDLAQELADQAAGSQELLTATSRKLEAD